MSWSRVLGAGIEVLFLISFASTPDSLFGRRYTNALMEAHTPSRTQMKLRTLPGGFHFACLVYVIAPPGRPGHAVCFRMAYVEVRDTFIVEDLQIGPTSLQQDVSLYTILYRAVFLGGA